MLRALGCSGSSARKRPIRWTQSNRVRIAAPWFYLDPCTIGRSVLKAPRLLFPGIERLSILGLGDDSGNRVQLIALWCNLFKVIQLVFLRSRWLKFLRR